jgi:hypothetical protein
MTQAQMIQNTSVKVDHAIKESVEKADELIGRAKMEQGHDAGLRTLNGRSRPVYL